MKIRVTMIMEVEDADDLEEAEEIFYEWDDQEFLEATTAAEITIEEA